MKGSKDISSISTTWSWVTLTGYTNFYPERMNFHANGCVRKSVNGYARYARIVLRPRFPEKKGIGEFGMINPAV